MVKSFALVLLTFSAFSLSSISSQASDEVDCGMTASCIVMLDETSNVKAQGDSKSADSSDSDDDSDNDSSDSSDSDDDDD